jgi:3-oxoacyl-[acyl-carrier-protein] synthase III
VKHPPMKYPVGMKSIAWARPKTEVMNDEPPFSVMLERGLIAKTWFRFWGIEKRAMMNLEQDTALDYAYAACDAALKAAEVAPGEVDLILSTLPTPLYKEGSKAPYFMFPRMSNLLRDKLGAKKALAWDMEMECLSFLLLIQLAVNFIQTGNYKKILICTTEMMSECMDFTTPVSSVFGDASAAAVITAEDNGSRLLSSAYRADGTHYEVATMRWRWPENRDELPPRGHSDFWSYFYLLADGRERMADFVPKTVPVVVHDVLKDMDMSVDDIKQFIFHQPGTTLVDGWANGVMHACGKSIDGKYPLTLTNNGCLASAAIPTTLLMTIANGGIQPKDYVLLAGLGTGWVYTAQLWYWGNTKTVITLV